MTRTSHHRRVTRLLLLLGALAAVAAVWTSAAQASLWPAATGSVPLAIAIDDDGAVYTANSGADTVTKINADGSDPGAPWPVAVGTQPRSLVVGLDGDVWVAVYGDDAVKRIDTTTGAVSTVGAAGDFEYPMSIALGPDGSMYVANFTRDSITKINPDGTIAGGTWPVNVGAHMDPGAIAVGLDGALYVANNWYGGITKVLSDGTTVSDGTWPTAEDGAYVFSALTFDAARNLYASGDAGTVVKFDSSGAILGAPWPAPVGAMAGSIAIDAAGTIFTANWGDNTASRVTQTGDDHAPPATPAAPSAVAGTGSATVTITPNAVSARFGAPTNYTVAAVRDATKHCTITAPATSCTITGLTGGTSYTFTATATLQAWTTASSSASLPVTPERAVVASPGKPTVAWSKAKRTVTALITPVAGVTYRLTATKDATTKTGTCKAVTVKGKARRRCTITLPKGAWRLAVTPTRAGTAGTAATKTYTIR